MLSTTSVAFVDDHPVTLQGLVHVLGPRTEYRLAATGRTTQDALSIAEQHQPDIMIIDLAVPGNALAIIQRIALRHPLIKVIVFTAAPGVEYAVNALEAGAKGYVSKACPADEFIAALNLVSAGETYVSQNFAAAVITALRNASVRKVAAQALRLSSREDQIVRFLLQGKTNKEIAVQLTISEKTVKHYMTILMQKLNARNRVEAVIAVQRLDAGASADPRPSALAPSRVN